MAMVYAWQDQGLRFATYLDKAQRLVESMDASEEIPMVSGKCLSRSAHHRNVLPPPSLLCALMYCQGVPVIFFPSSGNIQMAKKDVDHDASEQIEQDNFRGSIKSFLVECRFALVDLPLIC